MAEEPTKINGLVTGCSGRLRREVVSCLLKDGGYEVHSLDLFILEEENRNGEVCYYIQADITNLKSESFSVFLLTLLTLYVNVFGNWLTGTAPIHPQMTLVNLDFVKPQSHTYCCAQLKRNLDGCQAHGRNV